MLLGLRLSLLLLIAGCAEQALVVPDSDWRTVPTAQRDKLDRQYEGDLATARAELAAASANLAAFQRQPVTRGRPAQPPATRPDPDDVYAVVARDHEKARAEALGRVDAAIAELQRSDLAWRQLRVDAAGARIAVIISQRELTRGQAIDHNLPGTDTYDVAPLRGQFSRAQQQWYAIATKASAARDAFERASTSLASSKEAYAQLMRGGPMRLPELGADDDHTARLELTGWAVTRSDIRRRRGLRHFLDDAADAKPQLRKVAMQLSRAPRPAAAPAPASAPRGNPPSADARSGAAAPAADHPADRAGDRLSATAVSAGKPAPSPAPAPVARAAAPPAVDHPADRAASPPPAATAANTANTAKRPADAARPAPPLVPKDEHARPTTPPVTAVSTRPPDGGKGPPPPRTPARPAASTPTAAPAERSTSPAVAAPTASPRPAPAAAPTGVAKPVERPMPEANAR